MSAGLVLALPVPDEPRQATEVLCDRRIRTSPVDLSCRMCWTCAAAPGGSDPDCSSAVMAASVSLSDLLIGCVLELPAAPSPPWAAARRLRCSAARRCTSLRSNRLLTIWLSSLNSIVPEPSGSNCSKSSIASSCDTSRPNGAIARKNSLREISPSPFSSQSRKRSMTRTAFAASASRMSSLTGRPLDRSSLTEGASAAPRRPPAVWRRAYFCSGMSLAYFLRRRSISRREIPPERSSSKSWNTWSIT
mmetsp:Transcript_13450/g.34464  ORF Transcript_13450/g.34464 Transcript_13450/m.34464 type:complete len:248 (+) Transcript_13450:795-1538(+)